MTESRYLYTGPLDDHRRYAVKAADEGPEIAGAGGEGVVYRAWSSLMGEPFPVALKLLTSVSPADYPQLVHRLSPLEGLSAPNLMRHLDLFIGPPLTDVDEPDVEDFDVVYTVSEWIDGSTLTDVYEAAPPSVRLRWISQTARAVATLHGLRSPGAPSGVLHRDVKPSNIRIDRSGDATLLDFGVARPNAEDDLTRGTGTANWRAPEVISGPEEPGPASDGWAVGALAHWLFVGDPPRLDGADGARERLVGALRAAGVGDPIGVASHLSALLHTDPDRRPENLERWAHQLDSLSRRPRRPLVHRRPVHVAAAVALVGPMVVFGAPALRGIVADGDPISSTTSPFGLSDLGPWEVPCDGQRSQKSLRDLEPGEEVVIVANSIRTGSEPDGTGVSIVTLADPDPSDDTDLGGQTYTRELFSPADDRWLVSGRDDGTAPISWWCEFPAVGTVWRLDLESRLTGEEASIEVRALDPVESIAADIPIEPSDDGTFHVPVGTTYELPVILEARRASAEVGIDDPALDLEAVVVESSDPETFSVKPGVSPEFYVIEAKKEGDVVVTLTLRDLVKTYRVTVEPAET